MHQVIVILGPTAVGKSDVAVRLAKRFHGVIISADSRQVYRGLDIGSGKITQREMHGVPHFLLDVASPRGQYSVSHFTRDVRRVLKKVPSTTPVFLVGGSPFYIKTVTEPNSYSTVKPNRALRKKLERMPLSVLLATSNKLDPVRHATLDHRNPRRIIRAIEIATARKTMPPPPPIPMRVFKLGIQAPRSVLYRRIDQRVDRRLKAGMISEVKKLHANGVSWKRLEAFGLEYRFISRYLRGQLSRHDMTMALKFAIHDFARRQLTWWRKDQNIHWIRNTKTAGQKIRRYLSAA